MDQTQHRGASLTAVAILVLALCFSSHASALNKSAHTSKAHLKWEYCDASHAYPSNVTAVRMDPFPPKAGDKIKLIVAGDHGTPVKGGRIHFSAISGGLTLYSGSEDLCQRSKCADNAAGSKNGRFKYRAVERLPRYTPPGVYSLRVKVDDDNGNELLCLKTRLPVMPLET